MKSVRERFQAEFSQEIKYIDDIIQEAANSSRPVLTEAVDDLISAGGKRVRPLLLVSAWKVNNGGNRKEKILPLAAAVEILHMATLVHDDLIDEADKRRGVPSAGSKFGTDRALFVGDYLLNRAYALFHSHLSPEIFPRLDKVLKKICEGELKEFESRYDSDLSFLDYIRQIRRKTALLFGFATFTGAYEGGIRGRDLKLIYRYGIQLGMAFQIQDDILDFVGSPEKLGKPVGRDLANGVYSLPVLMLLQQQEYASQVKSILQQESIAGEDLQKLNRLMQKAGVRERVNSLLQRYIHRAKKAGESLQRQGTSDRLLFFLEILQKRNS